MYQSISNTFVLPNSMPAIHIRRDNEKILSADLDSYSLLNFGVRIKENFLVSINDPWTFILFSERIT